MIHRKRRESGRDERLQSNPILFNSRQARARPLLRRSLETMRGSDESHNGVLDESA